MVFFFAPVPDIQTEDDYHLGEEDETDVARRRRTGRWHACRSIFLLWFNTTVLIGVFGMILWLILNVFNLGPHLVRIAS